MEGRAASDRVDFKAKPLVRSQRWVLALINSRYECIYLNQYFVSGEHNWTINGAGLEFNHLFGYGVLDAGDMVDMARDWSSVPDRFHCTGGSQSGNLYA